MSCSLRFVVQMEVIVWVTASYAAVERRSQLDFLRRQLFARLFPARARGVRAGLVVIVVGCRHIVLAQKFNKLFTNKIKQQLND